MSICGFLEEQKIKLHNQNWHSEWKRKFGFFDRDGQSLLYDAFLNKESFVQANIAPYIIILIPLDDGVISNNG